MSEVSKICITNKSSEEMQDMNTVEVIANKGIVNDRYFSENNDQDLQITLIESEKSSIQKIKSKYIINCAGLNSINIARKVFKNKDLPLLNPVKGSYLRLKGKSPFKHIIYPAIVPGIIQERVDAVPDINSGLRFGPSIEKTNNLDNFEVPYNLIDRLFSKIKLYFPKLNKTDLDLDISGIRPKIIIKEDNNPDFFIKMEEDGWINLFGIESPGLTASLAIGEYILNEFNF